MASAFTLFGEINVETGDLKSSLRQIDRELKKSEKRVEGTEKAYQKLGKATATTARQAERFSDKQREISGRLKQANTRFKRGVITTKQYETAIKQAARATTSLKNQTKNAVASVTTLGQRMAKTSVIAKTMRKVGHSFQNIGNGLRNAGQAMLPVTAGIVALGIATVKSSEKIFNLTNKLKASTGSLAAAKKKLQEYVQLSKSSVGVTIEMAASVDALFRPMKGISDTAIPKLIKAFGKLKTANNDIDLNNLGFNLAQLFNEGFEKADMKQLFTAFPRIGQILAEKFGGDGSLEGMQKVFQNMKANGSLTMQSFAEGFADAVNKDKSLDKLEDGFFARIGKKTDELSLAIEPIGKKIAGVLEPAFDLIIVAVKGLANAFSELPSGVQTAIISVMAAVAAIAPLGIVLGMAVAAVGSFVSGLAAIGGALAAAFGVIGVTITASGALAAALALLAGVVIQTTIGIGLMAASAFTLYTAYSKNFGGIKTVVDDAMKFIRNAIETGSNEIKELTSDVTKQISEFWAKNGDEITKAAKATYDFLSSIVKSGLDKVRDFWSQNGAAITQIAGRAWDVIKTTVTTAVDVILKTVLLVSQLINGDWQGAWGTAKNIVSSAASAIGKNISNLAGVIFNALASVNAEVIRIGALLLTAGMKAGANIGIGLIRGIKSQIPSIKSAASMIAQVAMNATTGTLVIRSPSKVFFGYGENVVEGFVDGVRANATSISQTLRSVFSSALNETAGTINDRISGFRNILQELGVIKEPTILEKVNQFFADGQLAGFIKKTADALGVTVQRLKEMVSAATPTVKLAERIAKLQNAGGLSTGDSSVFNSSGGSLGTDVGTGFPFTPESNAPPLIPLPPPPTVSAWKEFFNVIEGRIGDVSSSFESMNREIAHSTADALLGIGDIFGNAIQNWDGTLKGFFASVAQGFGQMAKQIIADLIRIMIFKAILKMFGSFGGGLGGLAGGFTSAQIGGSQFDGFASGGLVKGEGTGVSDSILARLSNNEYVIKAAAVKKFGVGIFDSLNNLQMPQFNQGGLAMAMGGGGNTTSNHSTANNYNYSFSPTINAGNSQQIQATMTQERQKWLAELQAQERRNK